jgi:hypothetical protein
MESLKKGLWGWLPIFSLNMALGIVLISIACSGSRAQANWAQPVFWLGFLMVLIPGSVRLCMERVTRQERLGIIIMMAVSFYLIKLLYSPILFTFNDELQHWRSLNNIVQTGTLFQENPTLLVSAYFPGLENVTDAVLSLTGLSIYPAGMIVIGVAHTLLPLALFLLYERLSHSDYVAGIAVLIYFANPSFMESYSQFAYESLAVPLLYLALYLLATHINVPIRGRALGLGFAVLLIFWSIIITHHVTSYFLLLCLVIWAVVAYARKNPTEKRTALGWFVLLALSGCLFWLVYLGKFQLIAGYIGAPIVRAVTGLLNLILGAANPRTFFQGQGANPTPVWLQISSYISVLLIVLTMPLGFLALRPISKRSSLALTMGLLSLGYLGAQAMRVSSSGLVLTNRIAAPLFLPLSFLLATGAVTYFRSRSLKRLSPLILAIWVCFINIGSATAVIADRQLPGPYDPNVFTRHIDTFGLTAGQWAKETLGTGNRFGADFVNMMIMGSYGDQHVITEENDFFAETSLFDSSSFGQSEIDYIQKRGVEYLVIDNRLKNKLILPPQTPDPNTYPTVLDGLTTISRVYDSGGISIYHLGFVTPPPDPPKGISK